MGERCHSDGMSFDISVTHEAQHTRVLVAGRPSVGQLQSLLLVLEVDSTNWPHRSVLFDLTGLAEAPAAADRARLRDEAQRVLRRMTAISFRWPGGEQLG